MRQDPVMRCLVVLAILIALHRPSDACSVTRTFLPPSNFELVTSTPRIVISPLPEADTLAGKVIAKGGTESLVQGYGKARHPRAEARLAELAKNTKLPAETRKWLDRTIAERKDPP
jgi:hypothetical protein